jgi:chaperonin GroEL
MQSSAYGNLMQKGIIDPTKGVRAALQGAASVAGLLITTEARVAELPNKHATASGMPPAQARAFDTGAMSALAAH